MTKQGYIIYTITIAVAAVMITGFLILASGLCEHKPKPNIVDIVENYNVILLGDGTLQLQERK